VETNNPEAIHRIGLITMNTALEADIYENDSSTHVLGSSIINAVGGSRDFTRNTVRFFSFDVLVDRCLSLCWMKYISIFMAPSITQGEKLSTFVPMVRQSNI
jgi:acyl-CoA hydrolase